MERNIFFARFLITDSNIPGEGRGFVVEHYFTTKWIYILKSDGKMDNAIETRLTTPTCRKEPWVVETSNGLLIPVDDYVQPGWKAGYLNVYFKVFEDGVNFPVLTDLEVHSVTETNMGDNAGITSAFSVAAYAIGTVTESGYINSGVRRLDGTYWIKGTDQVLGNLTPQEVLSTKFMNKSAFAHPYYLPDHVFRMRELTYVGVLHTGKVTEPDPETDCCTSNANSLALVAAASLIASNNATSPLLIKQLEHAVANEFDATSTISALQSMRQLGVVSNVTGKVLDNNIPKSNDVVIIKNGPQE